MSWLRKLVGSKPTEESKPPEHAVIVYFMYGSKDLSALFALEDRLETAISAATAGVLDGNEVNANGTDASLYMYGPDADRLFDVVRPVLESSPFMKSARVKLRYGGPKEGVREREVVLDA